MPIGPSVMISINAALRSLRASRRNGSLVQGPVSRVVRTSRIFMSEQKWGQQARPGRSPADKPQYPPFAKGT